MGGYLFFNVLHNDLGAAHRHIDAQLLEKRLIAGIVDQSNGPLNVEDMLGHLANDQIVGIDRRGRHHQIGSFRPSFSQNSHLAAVTNQGHASNLFSYESGTPWISLDHQDLVTDRCQILGEVVANSSATDNEDIQA
jgi:hypothetical protein